MAHGPLTRAEALMTPHFLRTLLLVVVCCLTLPPLAMATGTPTPTCNGSIGDYVWLDSNRNGIQEAGEPGINGVKVLKITSSGSIHSVTTTTGGPNNAPGYYKFSNLGNGTYTIKIDRNNSPSLTDLFESPVLIGDDREKDSDSHFGTSVTISTAAQNHLGIDFGYYSPCTGKIGNYIWVDTNRDGIQNDGSTGLNGIRVSLANDLGTIIATTTTTGGPTCTPGYYAFSGLCQGNYTVQVDLSSPSLAGLVPSPTGQDTPATDSDDPSGTSVALTTDAAKDLTIDFGFYSPCTASIGDYVWLDSNRNGVQDSDETGVNGVTLLLATPSGQILEATTFTGGPGDSPGYYSFNGLCSGNYTLSVYPDSGPLAGLAPSPTGQGSQDADSNNPNNTPITIPTDKTADYSYDFGYFSPCAGSIGDYIWMDQNANGIQDIGETGINGVTVLLEDGINPPKPMTTFTGGPNQAPGYYNFGGLCAGDYIVEVDLTSAPLEGLAPSPTGKGTAATDSNSSPAAVVLPNDTSNDPRIDFGFSKICEGTIGNYVWDDANKNGIQDAGEMPLSGVMVNISGPNGYSNSMMTNAQGSYQFTGLCPGTYSVSVVTPAGYALTPVRSSDPNIDFDANN
ncbi:MAG: SdrD B-like domain-containing protein, partial [Trichloromonadaceae bacterium]